MISKDDRFRNLYVRKKLTVDGTIDPTNLDLLDVSSAPISNFKHGKLWIQNSTPQVLKFTREDSLTINVSSLTSIFGPSSSQLNSIAKWNNITGTLLASSLNIIESTNKLIINTISTVSQMISNENNGGTLRLINNNSLGTETNFSDIKISSTGILNLLPSSFSIAINTIGTSPLTTSDDVVLYPSGAAAETGITMFSSNTGTRFCNIRAGDSISGNNNFDIRFDNLFNNYEFIRGGNLICNLNDSSSSSWYTIQRFMLGILLSTDLSVLSRYKIESITTNIVSSGGGTVFSSIPIKAIRIGNVVCVSWGLIFPSGVFASGSLATTVGFTADFRPSFDFFNITPVIVGGVTVEGLNFILSSSGIINWFINPSGSVFGGAANSGINADSFIYIV